MRPMGVLRIGRLTLACGALLGVILAGTTSRAAEARTTIYLVTMGSGDDLYQRAGHAALEVERIDALGKKTSMVYNYGDADWDDSAFVWKFFRGTLKFKLSVAGNLEQVLAVYGRGQDRDVWRQRLALTTAQARQVAEGLAREAKPDRCWYPYHHIKRICTTRIRDLLDGLFQGVLRRQLQTPHPMTVRDYQPRGFRGHHLAFLGGDLFTGRLHDRPITDYYVLYLPDRLRESLQRVKVPDSTGKVGPVPLAGTPERLYTRWKPPAVTAEAGMTTTVVFGTFLVIFVILSVIAWWRGPTHPRWAGLALLLHALVFGIGGLLIATLMAVSTVPEFRQNELILIFWPTDLLLVGVAIRWLRGLAVSGVWLRRYAWAHGVVAGAWLVGQIAGVLYQRPLIISLAGAVALVGLIVSSRRFARGTTQTSTM